MKINLRKTALSLIWLSFVPLTNAQNLTNDFSDPTQSLTNVGRGASYIADGVLRNKGCYTLFGNPDWKDYTLSFRARAPKDAEQVQIWAGFRTRNRFDRYVLGIKGGLQDDVYLMRTGYMGADELMGVRPLGFHPEPGQWIDCQVINFFHIYTPYVLRHAYQSKALCSPIPSVLFFWLVQYKCDCTIFI